MPGADQVFRRRLWESIITLDFANKIVKSGMLGIVEEKLVCGRPPVGMCFYGKKMSVDATRQLTSHSVLTSCPPRVKMSYCDPLHV